MTASGPARTVAISCGDPSGIGPEVAARAWRELRDEGPLLWIGDPRHLPHGTPWHPVAACRDAAAVTPDALPVYEIDFGSNAEPGHPNPDHAIHIIAAISKGVSFSVRDGAALCTAPISKAALIDGTTFLYPGHTEFLAAMAGDVPVAMMLACESLKVVPATIHIPLSEVPQALTPATLCAAIRLTDAALKCDFGITAPRIAVAGLNPHAGEQGKIGREEIDWIADCIGALRDEGIDLRGPLPADTMFHAAARARYDAAVCMYHDQALIPIKTIDFDGGVNVTVGLPYVRTSPDHGTAFDIAGKGCANPASMIAAIRMARRMNATRAGAA